MKTPIADFVNEYINSETERLHMPGHKGVGNIEKFDITEIKGADYLHASSGIIKESEDNAARLFGSEITLYSTEGSSTVIKAMCYLSILITGKKRILAMRNAHKSFLDASALLDFDVDWIANKSFDNLCSSDIDYSDLEEKLKNNDYACIYITSPDYLGNMLDLNKIAQIAKKYNIITIADNAHGAYLRFLNSKLHPLECGISMCADSAHKTLPCFTGGAYLHLNKNLDENIYDNAKKAISIFSSTSPSYLILESLDLCNRFLENVEEKLKTTVNKVEILKIKLKKLNYTVVLSDPLKLTIKASDYGYTGFEMADILRKNRIEVEYSDPDYIVLMITEYNGERIFDVLENEFSRIKKKEALIGPTFNYTFPNRAMSIREACMHLSKEIFVDDANGKVMGYGNIICPPAISIVTPGEVIDENTIQILKYYGYEKVNVLI